MVRISMLCACYKSREDFLGWPFRAMVVSILWFKFRLRAGLGDPERSVRGHKSWVWQNSVLLEPHALEYAPIII